MINSLGILAILLSFETKIRTFWFDYGEFFKDANVHRMSEAAQAREQKMILYSGGVSGLIKQFSSSYIFKKLGLLLLLDSSQTWGRPDNTINTIGSIQHYWTLGCLMRVLHTFKYNFILTSGY